MKYRTLILLAGIFLMATTANAAIQYGGETYQASFAASTTDAVGKTVHDVLSGNIKNPLSASSTESAGTVVGEAIGFFARTNNWLKEKAGIDFVAILKGIGSLFLAIINFAVDILKKVL